MVAKDSERSGRYLSVLLATMVVLFAAVWDYTANQRLRFLPADVGAWEAHIRMIKSCDVGKATILGSSRANAAFIPTEINPDVTNLALSSSTPVEAYYVARKIFSCRNPPRFVALSFASKDWMPSKFFWVKSARYGLLTSQDMAEISHAAASLNDHSLYGGSFGSEPPPEMKNFLYLHHFPPYDFASLLASRTGGYRLRDNRRLVAETMSARGYHLMYGDENLCRSGEDPSGDPAPSFAPSRLNIMYFSMLVDFLKHRHAKVIFISPPTNTQQYERDRLNFFDPYEHFLTGISRREDIDIVGPTLPIMSICNFADPVHLNHLGAEKFTRMIRTRFVDSLS